MCSLAKPKALLILRMPYTASVIFGMPHFESAAVPVAAVSAKGELYTNPERMGQLPLQDQAFILAHEVLHLLLEHHGRMPSGADAEIWNCAADYAVNSFLELTGWTIPQQGLDPKEADLPLGLPAEKYYELLMRNDLLRERLQGGGDQGGSGKSDSQDRQGTPGDQPGQPNSGAGDQDTPSKRATQGGSAADGIKRPWESEKVDGMTRAAIEKAKRDFARHISQHGNMPDYLRRWAEQLLNPKVDWRQLLAHLVRQAACGGHRKRTFARPARRPALDTRIWLPGDQRVGGRLAVIIDSSGSMGDRDLARAMTEVAQLLRDYETTVIVADAAVHFARRVYRTSQIELIGGGGTVLDSALELAGQLNPDAIVVITDGELTWPVPPRNVISRTTIVLLVRGDRDVPSWASKVVMEVSDG